MVLATFLIALLTRAALKGERASAVQSATGFYYLAVVTAFTAEVAVKTRFLGQAMQVAAMLVGTVAEIVGWWFVSTGRFDVWKLMPIVLG